MEDAQEDGRISPTSSPPTPPSPLPISTGPGNQKYYFSPSPSPSPPFSPPQSSHTSAENLPLLQESSGPTRTPPLAFSLDRKRADEEEDSKSSCLKDFCVDISGQEAYNYQSNLAIPLNKNCGESISFEIFRARKAELI
ncbi:uncharacterized protein LOC115666000 [Syzygium oleosum]|uniref:uncharacterized protein LOC115666000 n=1 Tax=Syzygium oleosum TaxID=219896 RepID=UPI0024B8A341|nr:uncharacterized protein LOC115666000 [Syzygium oleosum]